MHPESLFCINEVGTTIALTPQNTMLSLIQIHGASAQFVLNIAAASGINSRVDRNISRAH